MIRKALTSTLPGLWHFGKFHYWRLRLATRWTADAMSRGLRRLAKNTAGSTGGSRVLFFATRQERDQIAMVSVLGLALKRRGCEVTVLGCDTTLRRSCNSGNYPALNGWHCRTCALFARNTVSASGLSVSWLGAFVTNDVRQRAERLVGECAPSELAGLSYRGFDVGHMVRHSVAHFLRTDRISEDSESQAIYREWIVAGICLVDGCLSMLDRFRPEAVVLLNGLFAPEWIMLEACRRRQIRVTAWEVGFRPHTYFFATNRATDLADSARWSAFREVPLTGEEEARLDRYLADRAAGGGYTITYFPSMVQDADAICSSLGIDRSKKLVLLFSNVTWDSTLFERDVAFSGMFDWIAETIEQLGRRDDAQLIIRVHPAECILPGAGRDPLIALIRQRFPKLPANAIIVPPESGVSSYVLMDIAWCGLVYGSTTAIEMGVRGVPVILAGDIYYRGLGLTIDPATRVEYASALDDILSHAPPANKSALINQWRRYAYFAIFRSAIELRQIRYPRADLLPELTIDTAAELDPGKDPNLDIVCNGITRGTAFLSAVVRDPTL